MAEIYNLVCDGNSLTAGTGSTSANTLAWPPVCRGLLITSQATHANKYWSVKSVAVSGHTTPQRTAAFATDVQTQFSTAYARNIVTFFEVINDVIANSATFAVALANVNTWIAQARTGGWDVMLATVPPTTNVTANPIILQFNTHLRDNIATMSDFPVVELAAHASLSNPANATFYDGDGIHLTDAGYAVVAGLFHDAIVATVDSGPDQLNLLKRIVYDFDQLEKADAVTWALKVAAIATESNRKIFQAGNMDRLRYRYSVYGYDNARLASVYAELVGAFTP